MRWCIQCAAPTTITSLCNCIHALGKAFRHPAYTCATAPHPEAHCAVALQVNFLGHWLLTHQLLSHQRHMRRRQHNHHNHRNGLDPVQPPPGTRVVILSSLTHPAGVVQWKDKQSERRYSPFTSYGLSKLCNIMAAREFEARFARCGALVSAWHRVWYSRGLCTTIPFSVWDQLHTGAAAAVRSYR